MFRRAFPLLSHDNRILHKVYRFSFEATRLLLARGLRDRNRLDEASIHYEVLLAESPGDPDLALEWGQALAWEEEYNRAAGVLSTGLEKDSTSLDLRIALAQVYYWWGKLE